ncbi:hypothetical protein BHE74_00058195 [Ensete ventricosum]|nr:hypothetical protein GW17_00059146 [Ensete ventricosum]RWW36759.1 hypothetical protein BHE74_00058195 [Ensete ventricosum]RZS28489.1 hypothetical protein BHM03_00062087 [Ensete ventricosum]
MKCYGDNYFGVIFFFKEEEACGVARRRAKEKRKIASPRRAEGGKCCSIGGHRCFTTFQCYEETRKKEEDWSESIGVQRRDTYRPWNHPSEAIVSMALEQPIQLVCVKPLITVHSLVSFALPQSDLSPPNTYPQNNSGRSYGESLLRFVRDAGPKAKMAAQMKLQQCRARWHDLQASSSATGEAGPSCSTNAEDNRVMKGPICELETDELLRRFTAMGTTGIPEGSLAASSEQRVGGNGSLASPGTAAAPPKSTSIYDLSFWQSMLSSDPSYATTQGLRRDAS